MCYSAQVRADYRKYTRTFGADISLKEFDRIYWLSDQDATIRIPKAVDSQMPG